MVSIPFPGRFFPGNFAAAPLQKAIPIAVLPWFRAGRVQQDNTYITYSNKRFIVSLKTGTEFHRNTLKAGATRAPGEPIGDSLPNQPYTVIKNPAQEK